MSERVCECGHRMDATVDAHTGRPGASSAVWPKACCVTGCDCLTPVEATS